jgi:hypothetical protein
MRMAQQLQQQQWQRPEHFYSHHSTEVHYKLFTATAR